MPTERKVKATSVQRRHSICQRSPTRPGRQHADGEGEGHGEGDEADVEQRRVDGHQGVVLEQRVRAQALRHTGRRLEGVRGARHEPEEEGRNEVEDEGGPADDGVGRLAPVAQHEERRDHGEDEAPQEDGAGQRRPHAGDGVEQRRHRAVVLGHEDDGEVVGEQRVLHGDRRPAPRRPAEHRRTNDRRRRRVPPAPAAVSSSMAPPARRPAERTRTGAGVARGGAVVRDRRRSPPPRTGWPRRPATPRSVPRCASSISRPVPPTSPSPDPGTGRCTSTSA